MRAFDRSSAAAYLASFAVPYAVIEGVLNGFDFDKSVYEHQFFPGDRLFQLIRRTSAHQPFGHRGNWYGLSGMTAAGVAVMDGLAGRRLHEFQVVRAFPAIEGTAVRLPDDWKNEIGGEGGATQIFVPPVLCGHIVPVGPAERW